VVSPETEQYVHHFVGQMRDTPCNDGPRDQSIFYAWAPGGSPKVMPEGYSYPFRKGMYLDIEVHYNNFEGPAAVGKVDNSGIEFQYQLEATASTLTTIALGDPTVTNALKMDAGVTSYTFRCDEQCFKDESEEVSILSVALHAHVHGSYIQLRQFRDGEIVERWTTEYYNFDYQDAQFSPVDMVSCCLICPASFVFLFFSPASPTFFSFLSFPSPTALVSHPWRLL